MKVTIKGQVTIPKHIRDKLGIRPLEEVEFIEERGRVFLVKKTGTATREGSRFTQLRGKASASLSTEEIMNLTRGQE